MQVGPLKKPAMKSMGNSTHSIPILQLTSWQLVGWGVGLDVGGFVEILGVIGVVTVVMGNVVGLVDVAAA